MAALADRALANEVLEYPRLALTAAIQKNDQLMDNLRRRRGNVFRAENSGATSEQLKAAMELARSIAKGKTNISDICELTPHELIKNNGTTSDEYPEV